MPNFYAYHINLSGKNQVDRLLAENQIAIGWSRARGLLNTTLTEEAFNAELDSVYDFSTDKERNKARKECWQFLREMKVGDIVAVKKNNFFHFVKVEGRPRYDEVDDDTAIRRQIVKLRDDSVHLDNLPEPLRSNLQFRPMSVVRSFLLNDVLAFLGINPEDAADEAEALEADELLMESRGSYLIPPKDELIVDRKHADVSAALHKHLDDKGFQVGNIRTDRLAPDLYTTCKQNPMLFEIKTGVGSGDYLKALGQLLFYEKQRGLSHRKYLVVPPGIQDRVVPILNSFDVSIIEYMETNGEFSFAWPS